MYRRIYNTLHDVIVIKEVKTESHPQKELYYTRPLVGMAAFELEENSIWAFRDDEVCGGMTEQGAEKEQGQRYIGQIFIWRTFFS